MNTEKECDEKNPCGDDYCEQCCPHDEIEDGHCLLCGADRTEYLAGRADHYLNWRDD